MRWGRRQGRSTKTFERITRCCRYLQQPSCAICEWCVLEREKLFIRNWTIDILSSISPPHACRHNEFTQNKKKFPLHHSQMEFGTWHIFLYICHRRGGGKCHSSSKTNDERTWSEMVIMRSQISEFYAFLFTSCFTCHVEFPSRALCIENASWWLHK